MSKILLSQQMYIDSAPISEAEIISIKSVAY